MMKMNVLIVEDERGAYNNLSAILKNIDPAIRIAGATESITQTVKWLTSHDRPDLIFMDIQLSDGSSFNIFNAISVETPVVFTTAYDDYALEAFRVNSIDYLLKPIDEADVRRALDKYVRLSELERRRYGARIDSLVFSGKHPAKLLVPCKDRLKIIRITETACFYSTGGTTRILLLNGDSYPYGKTLEAITTMLDPHLFCRANRQFILSREAIADIIPWYDGRLVVELNVEVPEQIFISKNRASAFKEWLTAE